MEYYVDLVLHLDAHLAALVDAYGLWVYGLLFVIIFAETGLVVTPFLPGDSLLFATGALAASGTFDIWLVAVLLAAAAILGDQTNYAVGRVVGPRVFWAEDRTDFWHRFLNREHLLKAHGFFERHGGKAVVLGHFMPIIRTFVPFVAGCGSMPYPYFAFYNVTGVLAWVGLCVGGGYFFGSTPLVKDNFPLVVLGIIIVSLLPAAWGYVSSRLSRAAARKSE